MKMHVFSDLHTEINGMSPLRLVRENTPEDTDLVVCAGDLTMDPRHGRTLLTEAFEPEHDFVYVPGNHEFYGGFITEHDERPQKAIVGGEVRILACTLWTDYALFSDRDRAMAIAQVSMADHGQILLKEDIGDGWANRFFTPSDALKRHEKAVSWLRVMLTKDPGIPTVVVTHHAPHPRSVAPEFEFDELTPAFCSDLTAIIEEFQPAVWVHGHTHSNFDYNVGETRMICNPYGYGYENPEFDPALIVEV